MGISIGGARAQQQPP